MNISQVIAKHETISEDSRHLSGLLRIENPLTGSFLSEDDEMAEKYFSLLDKATVEGLYQLYKLDFMLFDYTPFKFLQVAKG